jgi:hypothetical protein
MEQHDDQRRAFMRPPRAHELAAFVALATVCTITPSARASDTVAAQALFDDGKRLMAEGKPAEACPKFEESQQRDPGSGTLLNLADCYEKVGRSASAWSTYLEAAAAARCAGNSERETYARERAASLEGGLSKITVRVKDTTIHGLEVTRDGAAVGAAQWGLPIPADPGPHTFAAMAPGRRAWKSTVNVADGGANADVTVPVLEVDPNATKTAAEASKSGGLGTQRVLALVAGGIGVVGVGFGTYFTFKSKASHDETDRLCNHSSSCPTQDGIDASNRAQQQGNLATIGMIVGGVGVASGLALWFTAPSAPSTASTTVGVGLGGVHVQGAW